jgi:hypothetical protein
MDAIGGSILGLLATVVAFAPPRWALLGMAGGILFLTQGQALDVGGLTLYPMRCLELVGCIRVIARKELSISRLTGIDKVLLALYVYTAIVFLLRTELGGGTSDSIEQITTKAKMGGIVDAVLCYFTFRGLIATIGDLVWFLRAFVWMLGPYVALVSVEAVTGNNPLAIVGGMSTIWHDGDRMRCSGSFGHPSLLGTFGASFLTLYIAPASTRGNRAVALAGLGCCVGIVLLAQSGGPLVVVAIGIAGWALWTARTQMFAVRWVSVWMLVLLACVMKVPLWYLPHKMSGVVGGAGWHRSELMNKAIDSIDQWWLSGMALDVTADWFFYKAQGAVDLTNGYLAFGFDAGLPAIGLFVLLLAQAFRSLGRALAAVRLAPGRTREAEFLLWALGAVLAGHIGNFFAITYWDQTYAVWFMQLAAISSVSAVGSGPTVEAGYQTPAVWWAAGARADERLGA